MKIRCPYCSVSPEISSDNRSFVRAGRFRRKADCKWIQRFSCRNCKRTFSTATFTPTYRQKKRRLNRPIFKFFASGVSIRRLALVFRCSKNTVVRKLLFLGRQADVELEEDNRRHSPANVVQFDDLITFEHTKCKPLSCTIVAEEGTRRILGVSVARIPPSGPLAHLARKKYGPRRDEARHERLKLLKRIKPLISETALIKTDEWPQYPPVVRTVFPKARHETYKSKRAAIVGQGELKSVAFDPIFSINHTLAMKRANINRLARRTWCTTKKPERLLAHMLIYAVFHNWELIGARKKPPPQLPTAL